MYEVTSSRGMSRPKHTHDVGCFGGGMHNDLSSMLSFQLDFGDALRACHERKISTAPKLRSQCAYQQHKTEV